MNNTMKTQSHAELVALAAAWLRTNGCAVVITELVSGGETPDAIGWKGRFSAMIECKATRSDFLRDRRKFSRRYPEIGLGTARYYLAPKGLIGPEELPQKWGLIEVNEKNKTRRKRKAEPLPKNGLAEIGILISCIRRIGNGLDATRSVKTYTYETKATATLGIARDPV